MIKLINQLGYSYQITTYMFGANGEGRSRALILLGSQSIGNLLWHTDIMI